MDHPIVLYDGVCNYCNALANYIIRHDPDKRFRFAALQSAKGQELLRQHGLPPTLDSVVFIEDGKAHIKSDATIRIAPHLTGAAKLAVLLRIVPRFVRNWFYDFIAKHRYQWWGKQDQCIIPSQEVRDRFLDMA